jgi:hypothetical protein
MKRRIATRLLPGAAVVVTVSLSVGSATPSPSHPARHPAGLGKVLTSKDHGQIYGFDINQAGDDGVLTTAQDTSGSNVLVSMETFDQNTGKIVKSFKVQDGPRNTYSVNGIFAGDVALVTHFIVPQGSIYAKRKYQVMNPVTANKFTGAWTPPLKDVDIQLAAKNQDSATSVVYAIELKNNDVPDLIVSDVATNTFGKVIPLDPAVFGLCNGSQLAQYTARNMAVVAASPDCGAVGGDPPVNALVDIATGKITQFNGYNNGFYHAGYVNGLAIDPNTGIAATATELNSQVEFYNLKKQKGITFVQLPCTNNTDQSNSGTTIANDPVNKLFLVVDPDYCDGSEGGAIVVYDEAGNEIEAITGFSFASDVVINPPPRINPGKRMGWVFGGPGGSVDQLQQFFY